jgi:hypothetical protein
MAFEHQLGYESSLAKSTPGEKFMSEYKASCFCGEVELTLVGAPAAMGYCHCESCRHWSAGPINAFTLWQPDAVKVTKGQESLGGFNKTQNSHRRWCTKCGGHVFSEHPAMGLTDVYAAVIKNFAFKPALHVNYGEAVVHVHDGLPKQKDFPKEMGGSGVILPE